MRELKQKGAQNFELEFSKTSGSLNHPCHDALVRHDISVGLAIMEHQNLDKNDEEKLPLVQEQLLEQHYNLLQEIPELSLRK